MSSQLPTTCDVVIVGAGLAGLSASRFLTAAGFNVHVLEASDGVGGRVRTDHVDGFTLDRGFQILLTAYPELDKQFDVAALNLQPFDPGALVWMNGKGKVFSDPLRRPQSFVATAVAPIGSVIDKIRLALLRLSVTRGNGASLLSGVDMTTAKMLRSRGFSRKMIQRFFTPLVGGIQLDPQLTASRRMFDVVFRMLNQGDAVVPAAGMSAISKQLASHTPIDKIHLNARVTNVTPQSVTTESGHNISARAVIVAVEGPAASTLTGIPPVQSRSVGCVYFAAKSSPTDKKLIILDGTGKGPVLNIAVMSNIAASYAPEGQHLIAAALPGYVGDDVEDVARQQLQTMFGPEVASWRHLRSYRIAHGQPDQSPPFTPKKKQHLDNGIFVCGDHRDTASIQGALFSGRRCADSVTEFLARRG
jgi:predicted NAD/FAD-dependent oxidoreductase